MEKTYKFKSYLIKIFTFLILFLSVFSFQNTLAENVNSADTGPGRHPPIWGQAQSSRIEPHFLMVQLNSAKICEGNTTNCFFVKPGDYIGAFYQDNDGSYKYGGGDPFKQGAHIIFAMAGDDPQTAVKEGFSYGEVIRYRLFSWDTRKEYDIDTMVYDTSAGSGFINGIKWYPLALSSATSVIAKETFDAYVVPTPSKVCNVTGASLQLEAKTDLISGTSPISFLYEWMEQTQQQSTNSIISTVLGTISQAAGDFINNAYYFTATDSFSPPNVSPSRRVLFTTREPPTSDAGSSANICENTNYQLSGLAGGDSGAVLWSGGSSTFSDSTSLTSTYNPGAYNSSSPVHTLTLQVSPMREYPLGDSGLEVCNDNFNNDSLTDSFDENDPACHIDCDLAKAYVSTHWSEDFCPRGSAEPLYVCSNPATDTVSLTVVPSPEANAGSDGSMCKTNTSLTVNASASSNYSSIVWTTSGTGTFANSNNASTTYTPSSADKTNGSVTLQACAQPLNSACVASVCDTVAYSFTNGPTASAPATKVICQNQTASLSGTATDYSSLEWTTSGNGLFSNSNPSLSGETVTYTPGTTDISNGTVTTTFTANSATCSPATDSTIITVRKFPETSSVAVEDIFYTGTVPVSVDLNATSSSYYALWWAGEQGGLGNGDGYWSTTNSLSTTYFFGPGDKAKLSANLPVKVVLKTTAISPCSSATYYEVIISSTAYTFSGPSFGNVGVQSGNFTISPNSSYTGDITITPTGGFGFGNIVRTFNSAIAQTFTITPNSAGIITLTPTSNPDIGDPLSLTYTVNIPDLTPPSVHEETAVISPTNNTSPSYVFYSDEVGVATYGGDCTQSSSNVQIGNNTTHFNNLSSGIYNNCTIIVTDSSGNASSTLLVSSFTIDVTAPTLSEVTAVETPTTDTTPNYTFSSNEVGTILYSGSCISQDTSAVSGSNTITFNELDIGTYNDCKIAVRDNASNTSSDLTVSTFEIYQDSTPPVITEVTAIPALTNDSTPNYVFSSNENGTLSYPNSSCTSSTNNSVTAGIDKTITFSELNDGTYANCQIMLTDSSGNSSIKTLTSFTIDTTAPVLSQVLAVPALDNDRTPNYTFSSGENGTLSFPSNSSCSSASSGNQVVKDTNTTITFNDLADGTYTTCKIQLTDLAGNIRILSVNSFTIDTNAPSLTQVTAVPTPSTNISPRYTFKSTETGIINYGGSCDSSFTTNVTQISPLNTLVIFDELAPGTYSTCTITVTDGAGNTSSVLQVNTFIIEVDLTAPSLSLAVLVPNPVSDLTPSYFFNSTEAGYLSYSGGCSGEIHHLTGEDDSSVSVGQNELVFDVLTEGTYSSGWCVITVTDLAGNESASLTVNEFTVDILSPVTPTSTSATINSKTEITLSWSSDPSNTEYYAENITKGTNSGWITSTSYQSTGLTCNTNYSFQVKARNELNEESEYSTTVTAKTSSCGGGGGGGGGGGNPTPPPTTSVSCLPGILFDPATGKPCTTSIPTTNDCPLGALFNPLTGVKCSSSPIVIEVYCLPGVLFDTVTGKKCTTYTQTPSSILLTKTLKMGMTDNEVKLLQIYLNTHGHIVAIIGNGSIGNESTYFGQITKNAVIKFQLANGLKGDGVVGQASRNIINGTQNFPTTYIPPTNTIPSPTVVGERTLKLNMIGEDVKTLQLYLNTHGYIIATSGNGSPGRESTFFGEKTKQAVIKFQIANALTPDGVCGAKCKEKISQNP